MKSRTGSGRESSSKSREQVNRNLPQQMCACIEWVSESPDSLDFTHNVPLEWVQGYNPDEKDESYVVEWRQPPTPREGWHVYDGIIHEVSDEEDFLKSVMMTKKKEKKAATAPGSNNQSKEAINLNSAEFRQILAEAVRGAVKDHSPQRPKETERNRHSNQSEEKVLVGKALYLDRTAYNMAKLASSPGRMVAVCLRQAYSRKRLIRSSYAGQGRTINNIRRVKPSLKKYQKTNDIQNFVLERFPHISQSGFSLIVNQCLGEKPNKITEPTFVAESESEEEHSEGEN